MDIVMPGDIDGIEASKRIKEKLDIPIIFLTAYSDNEYIDRAKVTRPFGYILKPFQEREIKAAIEVALYNKFIETTRQKSDKIYQDVFLMANDPIVIVDSKMEIVIEVNSKARELLGLAEEINEHMSVWGLFPKDKIKKYKNIFADTKKKQTTMYEQLLIRDCVGNTIPVEASISTTEFAGKPVFMIMLRDISKRNLADWEKKLINELTEALKKIKVINEVITVCASCKKVKNEDSKWIQIEVYLRNRFETESSHSICPECARELYPNHHSHKKIERNQTRDENP